ncbi:hypothetical protein NA57DRAFT_52407 [Rhizodiscina lignyota]|uniref:Myb-like domain-containing protein n=1 Tax=Rhizodiscina lignyota TaxID=1504668 RepID=A0A9P4INP6_9PEZI|nr:hypothetical protein NA57DRAFT_52407 [Rhizodiscina lignyota]
MAGAQVRRLGFRDILGGIFLPEDPNKPKLVAVRKKVRSSCQQRKTTKTTENNQVGKTQYYGKQPKQKKSDNANASGAKEEKEKKDEKPAGDGGDVDTFTTEQDAELVKMKSDNKTWKEIAEALGKPKHVLTKRYKELQQKDGGQQHGGQSGDRDGGSNKGKKEKQGKGENKDAWNADKSWKKKEKEVVEEVQEQTEYVQIEEDEDFSTEALEAISRAMHNDNAQYWLRIQERVFKETGWKFHPKDIQEKMESVPL